VQNVLKDADAILTAEFTRINSLKFLTEMNKLLK